MRGWIHDKEIREFSIDGAGMHLLRPFRHVTGILSGTPVHVSPADIKRIWTLYEAETNARAQERSKAISGDVRSTILE